MKRILSVLLITSLFAGNIELDGDVNVTGTIQSQTIESLLEQIAQLQEQIALLQAQLNDSQGSENQLETRYYDVPLDMSSNSTHSIDILEITGYDLDFAIVSMVKFNNLQSNDTSHNLYLEASYIGHDGFIIWDGSPITMMGFDSMGQELNSSNFNSHSSNPPTSVYDGQNSLRFRVYGGSMSGNLRISVTAQFPN